MHPTPSAQGANSLGYDVLAALGRPVTRLAAEKISGLIPAWQVVAAWVAAEEIKQVVVLRAHRLARPGWERLLELRARTGVALVLVWHEPAVSPAAVAVLDGVPYGVISDPAEVIDPDRLPPSPDPGPDDEPDGGGAEAPDRVPDTRSRDLPTLPDGDVTSFRAEAFRRLPTHQFLQVDDVYHRGLRAACRWLSGHPEQHRLVTEISENHDLRRLFPGS